MQTAIECNVWHETHDYTDYNLWQWLIDKRMREILILDSISWDSNDCNHRMLLIRQIKEWMENFPYKKEKVQNILSQAKDIDSLILELNKVLEAKFEERRLFWNSESKDLMKIVDEAIISKITSYLTTSFLDLQKNMQNFILKKTRWDESISLSQTEQNKIRNIIMKLNEYKNKLIEDKRKEIIIKLFWEDRASWYYSEFKSNLSSKSIASTTLNKISVLERFKSLIQ